MIVLIALIVILWDRQPSTSDTFSSLTSTNCNHTLVVQRSVSVLDKLLCVASRHSALQGGSLVDHLLPHGLSVSLQGFLFVVVLVHDGSIRFAHNVLGTNWALHDLWLGIFRCPVHHLHQDLRDGGDILDVWSGIGHHLFGHVHRDSVAMGSTMAPLPRRKTLQEYGKRQIWLRICGQTKRYDFHVVNVTKPILSVSWLREHGVETH